MLNCHAGKIPVKLHIRTKTSLNSNKLNVLLKISHVLLITDKSADFRI